MAINKKYTPFIPYLDPILQSDIKQDITSVADFYTRESRLRDMKAPKTVEYSITKHSTKLVLLMDSQNKELCHLLLLFQMHLHRGRCQQLRSPPILPRRVLHPWMYIT